MSLSLLSDLCDLCEFDSAFLHIVTLELQFSDLEKLNLFQTRVYRGGSSIQELIDCSQIRFRATLSKWHFAMFAFVCHAQFRFVSFQPFIGDK